MFKKLTKKVLKSYPVTRTIFWILVSYMNLVSLTCKIKINFKGNAEKIVLERQPCLIPCWHSRFMMLLPIKKFGSFYAVTSAHADGNYLEMILKHYKHKAIRGSSRKQGANAVRSILAIPPEEFRLVVTPDGPLGPKFVVKGGILRFAKKLKVPIVPVCYSATHAIVLKTWDRFIIPIPFISRIHIEFGPDLGYKSVPDEEYLQEKMLKQTKSCDKTTGLKIDY